jgi:hypothetical protein
MKRLGLQFWVPLSRASNTHIARTRLDRGRERHTPLPCSLLRLKFRKPTTHQPQQLMHHVVAATLHRHLRQCNVTLEMRKCSLLCVVANRAMEARHVAGLE